MKTTPSTSRSPLRPLAGRVGQSLGCRRPLWVAPTWWSRRPDRPRSACSMVLPVTRAIKTSKNGKSMGNHGKSMGNPWEIMGNHGKSHMCKWRIVIYNNDVHVQLKKIWERHIHRWFTRRDPGPASTLVISSTLTPAKGPSFLPSLDEKPRRSGASQQPTPPWIPWIEVIEVILLNNSGGYPGGYPHISDIPKSEIWMKYGSVSKPCTPVVHIKIAGKWMFIPLKMVLIGIDPYPYSKIYGKCCCIACVCQFDPLFNGSLTCTNSTQRPARNAAKREAIDAMALRSWGGGRPIESIRIPHCWGVFWKFQVESNRDNRVSGSKKIRTSSTTDAEFCTKSRLDERLPEPCSWVSNVSGRSQWMHKEEPPGPLGWCSFESTPRSWKFDEPWHWFPTGEKKIWLDDLQDLGSLKVSRSARIHVWYVRHLENTKTVTSLITALPTYGPPVKWTDSNILSAPDCLQWTKSQVFGGRQEVSRAPWGTKIAG